MRTLKYTCIWLFFSAALVASGNCWDAASDHNLKSFFGLEMSQKGGYWLRQPKNFHKIDAALEQDALQHKGIDEVLLNLKQKVEPIFYHSLQIIKTHTCRPVWCESFEDIDSLPDAVVSLQWAAAVKKNIIRLLFYLDIADVYCHNKKSSDILTPERPTDIPEKYRFILGIGAKIKYIFRDKSQRFIFESLKSFAQGYLLIPISYQDTSSPAEGFHDSFLNALRRVLSIERNYCARAREIKPNFDKEFVNLVLKVVEEDWEQCGLELALAGYFATHEQSIFPLQSAPFEHVHIQHYFSHMEKCWRNVDSVAIRWIIANMARGDQADTDVGVKMICWGKLLIKRVLKHAKAYEPVLSA